MKKNNLKANIVWYEKLAEYYDLLDGVNVPYQMVTEILDEYFKKYSVKSVLDFACGTGGFTIPLKQKGYEIVGVDISGSMLKEAREKIKNANLRIPLFKGDIRNYQAGKFDALICMFNSGGDLSKKGFYQVVHNMNNNLKNGGILCFDILNYDFAKAAEFSENSFLDANFTKGDISGERFSRNILNQESQSMKVEQQLKLHGSQKKVKTVLVDCIMQMYEEEEIKNLLEGNGFKIVKRFGNYSPEKGLVPFSKGSPFIGIIAKKITS